ncbi:MAG: valine--tRNA ligase [Bdellovibrionales bacterium]|nr:valine--tRNA ligase [Bdellovibrionales bacterium]
MTKLSDRYSPQEVEKRIYAWWTENNYFSGADKSTLPPFSIILPPPNVTGSLHLGHALDHTIQDVLVRWKRMSGFNVLWLPGTDHAGIATQSVVEKDLKKKNLFRTQLGRDQFVEKVWEWKNQYGDHIVEQMKRLGESCDWNRLCFTLDEGVSKAVRKVFVSLYEKGQIYRGKKLINWSPGLESAISDLEVEYIEVKGQLYYIKYPLEDGSGELTVATTRPETLLGDVAVAVHPEDERYASWIGKNVHLPLTQRKIPVIGDESVDREFGSGVVKITPAHDFNDYNLGLKHQLPQINILNKNGTLNDSCGVYTGLSVVEARKRLVSDLEQQNLLIKTEPHTHQVGHCSRSGWVVEPLLSEQWFVRMKELAGPAQRVVESGTITFEPESWTKTYLHWMEIIQDWCISRQLWWGHRIPAWTCLKCLKLTIAEEDPKRCQHCAHEELQQDEDVLDTWFSSALWPFSTMGWPEETETQKTFYPTSVLVTGHDIIFFWVARMIMMGLEFKKDVPFRKVYIHGLIRDANGKKMSKSSGTALDPVKLIDEVGADALRFTLISQLAAGRDLKFSLPRLEGYRNFMNKIWNAARFSLQALNDFKVMTPEEEAQLNKNNLSTHDKWILFKLGVCEKEVEFYLNQFRFSESAQSIYEFVWHQFCDWYLELIKPSLQGPQNSERVMSQWVLAQVLNRVVRLLHPFAPFISEEIYQMLPVKSKACILEVYPTVRTDRSLLAFGDEASAQTMDIVVAVITAIRNIRGENRIKPGLKITVRLSPSDDKSQKILGANKAIIMRLAGLDHCEVGPAASLSKCALSPIRLHSSAVDVIVPLEGLVDLKIEVQRIHKNLEKLKRDFVTLEQRLQDKSFLKQAPEEVVRQGHEQLITLKSQMSTLEEAARRLS